MANTPFLERFRKSGAVSNAEARPSGRPAVYFQIAFDDEGVASVAPVDKEGEPLENLPDYRLYHGETFNALRAMAESQQQSLFDISWGGQSKGYALANRPSLLFALLRCDNLVDSQMHPIKVSDKHADIVLHIECKQEMCHPVLLARCEGEMPRPFRLLSDVFALVGDTIFPIASLGGNYLRLAMFEEDFPLALIEQYLSVFYSYIDNCLLDYADYTLVMSDQPATAVPTLIIEKVDADMALYLRLTHSLPGMDADFVRDFDLTRQAQLTIEHQVLLRRIEGFDEVQEQEQLLKTIGSYAPSRKEAREVWHNEGEFIVPQETAGPFLMGALPILVQHYQLLGAEKLKEYRVKAVRPHLNLALSSGIDFLEGSADLDIDGEHFSLRQFLEQYRKQKYITLTDGNRALIDANYVHRLERIFRHGKKGDDEVSISYFDLPEIEALLQAPLQGKAFKPHRDFYEGFNSLSRKHLRLDGVNATLRNYQREGVKWIRYLYDNHRGGCLADDMGLGKTLQTIAMLTLVYPQETTPSLIVMPRSLLFNWQDELGKFAPQLSYHIYYGAQRDLDEAYKHQLVLTTYALVRNDIEQFRKRKFHYIILDESQNIKNLGAQSTQAVFLLQGEHRLALSGTPIENNLTELYSLFRFLNPTMLGTADDFNRQYAYPIQRESDQEATESLRRKIFPFILRRMKKDVLKELPDRMEQTLYVEMDDDHRRAYEERRRYYQELVTGSIAKLGLERSQMVMFQALSELRRMASMPESLTDGQIASPKLPLLAEQVEELVASGHKVVLFFNFIAGIELMGERLSALGIDYTTMTGSTRDRRAVVERFQNDPTCRALLMTLKTGGVGLNLTVADTVYIVEPWWNKAAEEQAINRLHRIGQTAKVMSYALITHDTIEEKIRLLQQQKKDLADSLITGDSAITKHLSEEDIRYILG